MALPRYTSAVRIAVVGHVEHVTIARANALPRAGEILHLGDPVVIAGGGGGIAFFQLTKSDVEVHLFTAIGLDEAGTHVHHEIASTGATIHAGLRQRPHTRDIVVITPEGERTIFVVGEPLHPQRDDRLSWDELASCDAAYFTGQDPATLVEARRAKLLVVTARRAEALAKSGVRADVVVGSARDPREAGSLGDYATPPGALVMTDGRDGGYVETGAGRERFSAPIVTSVVGGYGAGDSFAGALTWYLASGLTLADACSRAAEAGAAVLRGINPLEHQMRLA
jgi:ribokinase